METPDLTLELSTEEMQRLMAEVMEYVVAHVASLPRQPSVEVEGGVELARTLVEPLPTQGQPAAELLGLLFGRVIPKSFNTAGPGYLAYVPGGGIFHTAAADFITDAVNRYMGLWVAAPGLAQIEATVIRWFCEIIGYPRSANGLLTTGGSLANFSAIVTARRERLPENFLTGVIYASDQVHHSIIGNLLERQIAADRQAGLAPFLLVGNAGSTNTGAVDDLDALADLAERECCWLHVDAAYGGFFMLTEQGRALMRGVERADSVTLDPHKGLFLPYGTGSLLMRDGGALKRAHGVNAQYLPAAADDPDLTDFSQMSPELSRGFRGLRVWLPLKMHGIGSFRRNLEEKLALTRWAAEELRKIDSIEIVAKPQLSIVAFRLTRAGLDAEALNHLTRDLLARINARKRIFLSGTQLGDCFVIRICILSFRTHLDRMQMGVEDIRKAVEELKH